MGTTVFVQQKGSPTRQENNVQGVYFDYEGTKPSRSCCSNFRTSSALVAFARASRILFLSSAVMSLPAAPGVNVFRFGFDSLARAAAADVRVAERVVARDVGSLSGVKNNCLACLRS